MTIRNTKMAAAVQNASRRGYRVREDGSVVSPFGRVLTASVRRGNRYLKVQCGRDQVFVHQLSAYQRYGPRTLHEGMQVRHRNGDHLDNRPNNLLLGSAAQNHADIAPEVRKAFRQKGQRASSLKRRKLTPDQVREIRHRREDGVSLRKLAAAFGVSKPVIQLILKRVTYQDVK